MKFNTLLLFVLFISCNNINKIDQAEEVITYDSKSKMTFILSDLIESIEITPLQTLDDGLFGDYPELLYDRNNHFVVDRFGHKNILRFDLDGKFLNSIGAMGKSGNEYIDIQDVEINQDSNRVSIFSSQNKAEYIYNKNGDFISKRAIEYPFYKIARDSNSLWLYLGYNSMYGDDRVIRIDNKGKIIAKGLNSKADIITLNELFQVFVKYNGRLLLRESLNPTIYQIEQDKVSPLYTFDFGKYNVPAEYFEIGDVYKAGELLMKSEFVVSRKLLTNESYMVLNGAIQNPQGLSREFFGIKTGNNWLWINYDLPKLKDNIFVESIQYITPKNELVFLVDARRLINAEPSVLELIKTPNTIKSLSETDNHIIVKCKLK